MVVNIVIRLLMAFEAVVCLMLIGIILIQRSKGQGMGLSFGGGAAEAVFGGQMGNVLTRTTVILAVLFLVNTTVLAVLKPKGASADVTDRFDAPAPSQVEAAVQESVPVAAEPIDDGALLDVLGAPAAAPEAPAAEPEIPAEAPEAPAAAPETPAAAPETPAAAPEAPEVPEAPEATEAPAVEAAPEAPAA